MVAVVVVFFNPVLFVSKSAGMPFCGNGGFRGRSKAYFDNKVVHTRRAGEEKLTSIRILPQKELPHLP